MNIDVEKVSDKWNEDCRESGKRDEMDGHLGNVLNENTDFVFADGESQAASTVVGNYQDQFDTRKGSVENAFSEKLEYRQMCSDVI